MNKRLFFTKHYGVSKRHIYSLLITANASLPALHIVVLHSTVQHTNDVLFDYGVGFPDRKH